MANKKERTLAGFGDVAGRLPNEDILDIVEQKEATKLVGIYFEPDVAERIDQLSKGKPRGYKSKLVNNIVREALGARGLL